MQLEPSQHQGAISPRDTLLHACAVDERARVRRVRVGTPLLYRPQLQSLLRTPPPAARTHARVSTQTLA